MDAHAGGTGLRLLTFGGLTLLRNGELDRSPASQRRRLALLALVAAAGRHGISRDKLLGYLWPEGEPEQAKQALHQATYALRRSLGADDLFVGTTAIRLNPDRLTSDVGEFDEAMASGDHERAAALYAGPFLDGYFLDGVPEFERWIDAERSRRAREYAAALEALATAAQARGDCMASVGWRQRLAAVEPLSARTAAGLIQSLVAAGDRAGALLAAQLHGRLVRQDLETDPEPVIADWIARLRAGDVTTPASVSLVGAGAGAGGRAPSSPPGPSTRGRDAPRTDEPRGARMPGALGERYTIGRVVEEGTVACTYEAVDRRTGRDVLLHVVSRRLVAVAGEEHFLRIYERVASLVDPRVAPVTDFGAASDALYYATPRAAGLSLRERLARERPLPLLEAVRIGEDVAAALDHAHSRGVVHGDLRPKHITVVASAAVVTGFGLVEALGAQGGGGPADTGVTIGAPAYLSPEQLTGQTPPDARTDIYSLGCILYEMLAGKLPFGGDGDSLVSRKLTQPAPSPRAVRESIPDVLDRAVRRCLARTPADRFRTAGELCDALAKVREAI